MFARWFFSNEGINFDLRSCVCVYVLSPLRKVCVLIILCAAAAAYLPRVPVPIYELCKSIRVFSRSRGGSERVLIICEIFVFYCGT